MNNFKRRHHGFISVGAVCQRSLNGIILWVLECCDRIFKGCSVCLARIATVATAWLRSTGASSLSQPDLMETEKRNRYSSKRRCVTDQSCCFMLSLHGLAFFVSGIKSSVLRHWGTVTRRVNSSLRSHRTRRSYCRRVYSGLNKTMYASVGPNSRCRGHQGANPAEPGSSLEEKQCHLGRMKPSRGHQSDGTSLPKQDATQIPPYVYESWSSPGLSRLFLSSQPGLVGRRRSVSGRSSLERFSITDHGVYDSQQSPAHGDVGLGLADPFRQSLASRFLAGVTLTEGDGRLTQGPAKCDRTRFGDIAALGASGRLLHVGRQAGPELQRVGVR